jgi:uncharacterized membrane protein YfcA
MDWTLTAMAIAAAALFAGGFSKGATGIGLPPIATPIIAMVTDVPTAVGLMAVPIVISNAWQAVSGGLLVPSIRRFRLVLVAIPPGVVLGGTVLSQGDPDLLFMLLGIIVSAFAALSLLRPGLHLPGGMETKLALPVGLAAGIIGGISSLFVPVLASFLLSLRLKPEEFVAGLGLLFLTGGVTLTLVTAGFGLLTAEGWIAALFAIIPVTLGQVAGRAIRRHIDAETFRKIVLAVLLLIGLNLLRRAVMG